MCLTIVYKCWTKHKIQTINHITCQWRKTVSRFFRSRVEFWSLSVHCYIRTILFSRCFLTRKYFFLRIIGQEKIYHCKIYIFYFNTDFEEDIISDLNVPEVFLKKRTMHLTCLMIIKKNCKPIYDSLISIPSCNHVQ